MSDTSSDGTNSVELDKATVMKLRRKKARLDNGQPDCPNHSLDSFICYLLDTEQAVRDGYYGDSDTGKESDRR